MQQLVKKIKDHTAGLFDDLVAIRRHLHAHPELSYKEFKTAKYISQTLSKWNIKHKTGVAETGISGSIKGEKPGGNYMLRADIDALPILEENTINYVSKNSGVMHACGHDVHTACLLGALHALQATKNDWGGIVHFIFQPGEEKLPGGATLMIKEGVLKHDGLKGIFGQHVFPELEVGKVGFCSGNYMASTDEIYITFKGTGGHAALPHQVTDPVAMAASFMVEAQKVISRFASPIVPSVLSFGKVVANGATNIIPPIVNIEGTFRTMDESWRKKAHKHITDFAKHVAEMHNGEAIVDIKKGYPVLNNDNALTANANKAAIQYLGGKNVVKLAPRMTAEDFAYYAQQLPGCFYRLGTRNAQKGITHNLHTPNFNIDEDAIKIGAGLMAFLAISACAHH